MQLNVTFCLFMWQMGLFIVFDIYTLQMFPVKPLSDSCQFIVLTFLNNCQWHVSDRICCTRNIVKHWIGEVYCRWHVNDRNSFTSRILWCFQGDFCYLLQDVCREDSNHGKIVYCWQEINLAITGNRYFIIFLKYCHIVHKYPCFGQVFSPFFISIFKFCAIFNCYFLVNKYFLRKRFFQDPKKGKKEQVFEE